VRRTSLLKFALLIVLRNVVRSSSNSMNEQLQSEGKANPFPPELLQAGAALREVVLAAEQYRQAVAIELHLDVRQTQAVSYLYSRGAMGQSELADALLLNTSSVTALVDRLEAHAIATRQPHPTDRRRSVIELTDKGRDVIARTAAFLLGAFNHVDPTELPRLTATLSALATDLRAQTDTLKHQHP
jgi:DNA-binding MarR family transcriptional regulator